MINKLRPCHVCGLLIACAGLLAPLFANAPYGVGICAHAHQYPNEADMEKEYALIREANIRWLRNFPEWRTIQQDNGVYNFANADRVVRSATKAGLSVLGLLAFTPQKLSTHSHVESRIVNTRHKPENLLRAYEFAYTVAKRYENSVQAWEIWNEPDTVIFWRDTVEDYADLLKSMYLGIKDANKEAIVIGCGTGTNFRFIDTVLRETGGQYMDRVSVHPYLYPDAPNEDNLGTTLKKLRALLDSHNPDLGLWITEAGYPTVESGSGVSESEQGNLLQKYIEIAWANSVENVFIYNMRDSGKNSLNKEHRFGIVQNDYTPKESYYILQDFLKKNSGQPSLKPLHDNADRTVIVLENYESGYFLNEKSSFSGYVYNFSNKETTIRLAVETDKTTTIHNASEAIALGAFSRVPFTVDYTSSTATTTFRLQGAGGGRGGRKMVTLAARSPLSILVQPRITDDSFLSVINVKNVLGKTAEFALSIKSEGRLLESMTRGLKPNESMEIVLPALAKPDTILTVYNGIETTHPIIADFPTIVHKTITVDGRDDDWHDVASRFAIYQHSQVKVNPRAWKGMEDLSSIASLAYDSEFLYLRFSVTDNVVEYNSLGSMAWKGDANIEIFFDTDLSDRHINHYNEDDYQIFLTLANEGVVAHYFKNSTILGDQVEGVKATGRRTAGGYFIEAAIPLSVLRLEGDLRGRIIGFNYYIDDSDYMPTREKQACWQGGTGAWSRPSEMTKIRFQ
ncbi:beta-1,4-xylanase [Opitutaceae bacterium TAV1]|nr:beta-1,4-xylanase [Opitutaceae bacterium TAV1]